MAKNKFKVGDIVKDKSLCTGIKKAEVLAIIDDTTMKIKLMEHNITSLIGMVIPVYSKDYEKVKEETIVIYRKDNKVIALDKSTGKKDEARCNPADKFVFHDGAKLAFSRLMGEPDKKEEIPKEFLEGAKLAGYIVDSYERAGFTHEEALRILETIITKGAK